MNIENDVFDIVVVGSNMVDLLAKIPRLPTMGETLVGNTFHLGYGGKGANQAVMAAKLGARVAMVTKVGDDVFGPMTRENFVNQNINVDFVFVQKDTSSGVAPILVDENGRNMIVVVPGANMKLSPADVELAAARISKAKIIISQLEIQDETIIEAFKIAKNSNVMTILNPAPARTISNELIQLTDLIVPNETEAEILTGVRVVGKRGSLEAAKSLIEQGTKTVILTLGENGTVLLDNHQNKQFPAFKVKAIDSTGAGDAFIGSLAYALVNDYQLSEAIEFANRCAAISVTKIGTQISFPTLYEVNSFSEFL